jgi:hypothetical protein
VGIRNVGSKHTVTNIETHARGKHYSGTAPGKKERHKDYRQQGRISVMSDQ